jgi:iron-sulfur cluster repair protein YtfE (RIC family)
MRNGSNELNTVDQLARKLPEARAILREARIDSSNRMDLRTAALAAGTNPDELLAQIEARMQRQARRAAQTRIAEHELEYA